MSERKKMRKLCIDRVINSAKLQGLLKVGKRITVRDEKALREILEWTFGWGESVRNDKIIRCTKDWS